MVTAFLCLPRPRKYYACLTRARFTVTRTGACSFLRDMAATVWKGYITSGLISVPVRLFAAARTERVSFHMIHDKCSTRIKAAIVLPDLRAGGRAYTLLLETMQKTGYAAIAKMGMHQREYIVVIRPREQGLTLHTMYYPNEVRAVPEYGHLGKVEIRPQEIQLAEQLVKSVASPFEPQKYEDEYQKRLVQLIESKSEGKTVRVTPERKRAPVIDLIQALQKSLGQVQEKKPARAASRATDGHAKRAAAAVRRRKTA